MGCGLRSGEWGSSLRRRISFVGSRPTLPCDNAWRAWLPGLRGMHSSFPIRTIQWPRLWCGKDPRPRRPTATEGRAGGRLHNFRRLRCPGNRTSPPRRRGSPPSTPNAVARRKHEKGNYSTLTMAETSNQADPQPHEQCWECRRRRLVCDGTQPVCAKCRAAGIVCPGFADKKPLTWLAPGQVMSRAGRKKAPRKTCNNKTQRPRVKPAPATPRSDSTSDDPGASPPHDLLIGTPFELRPEVCDVFEAIMYCTSVFCLAPNPAVRP